MEIFWYMTHRSRIWVTPAGRGMWRVQPPNLGISLPKFGMWILPALFYLHVTEHFSSYLAGNDVKKFWTQFLIYQVLFPFFAMISALLEIRNLGALSTSYYIFIIFINITCIYIIIIIITIIIIIIIKQKLTIHSCNSKI